MPFYWSLRSIPELADLSDERRRAVWRACYGSAFRHWQTWLGMLLCGVCIFATWYACLLWSRAAPLGGLSMWLSLVLLGSLGGGLGVVINQQIIIAVLRPYLRAYRERHLRP